MTKLCRLPSIVTVSPSAICLLPAERQRPPPTKSCPVSGASQKDRVAPPDFTKWNRVLRPVKPIDVGSLLPLFLAASASTPVTPTAIERRGSSNSSKPEWMSLETEMKGGWKKGSAAAWTISSSSSASISLCLARKRSAAPWTASGDGSFIASSSRRRSPVRACPDQRRASALTASEDDFWRAGSLSHAVSSAPAIMFPPMLS